MIVVVGGGITGLAVARRLARDGLDVVALEADRRPGGVIRSEVVDGHVVDYGPQRARLTPPFRRLVEDLGLVDELVIAPDGLGLLVFHRAALRAVPFSLSALVRSDVIGWSGKLRLLLEPLTAAPAPDERVGAMLRRKLGDELYRALLAPLYGGLYGSDPDDMVVGAALGPTLDRLGVRRSLLAAMLRGGGAVDPPPACSFRGGMAALPAAMADALGPRVRLGTPVTAIEPRGSAWSVTTEDGGRIEAEQVVVATQAPAAARLLSACAPRAARTIAGLRANPLAVVHLRAETDLRAMGFQVSYDHLDLALRGVTFHHALFARSGLYTAFLGGSHHPEVAALDPDALGALAVETFRRTTGRDAYPLACRHVRMPAWDTTWTGLDAITLPEGIHVAGSWRARPGLPGRFAEAEAVANGVVERARRSARPSA